MELSKDEIINWFYKYNYPENEDIILDSIDMIKTWEDFKLLILGNDGILKWKGALRTRPLQFVLVNLIKPQINTDEHRFSGSISAFNGVHLRLV